MRRLRTIIEVWVVWIKGKTVLSKNHVAKRLVEELKYYYTSLKLILLFVAAFIFSKVLVPYKLGQPII